MGFKEEVLPYLNKYGTINQSKNNLEQDSGNSLLYYGDYIQILNEIYEELPNSEQFESIIQEYYVSGYSGLLNREPNNRTHEAFDDYVGVLSAASLVSSEIAKDIFVYGQKNKWYFDNEYPYASSTLKLFTNPKNYFGRMNGFIAHAYFANKLKPSLFERIRWVIALLSNSWLKRDGTSETRLLWHFVKTYEKSNLNLFFCNLAVRVWKRSFWKDFKNGMGDLFEQYFTSEHPFAIYMKGKL